jgi:hypothetical protein
MINVPASGSAPLGADLLLSGFAVTDIDSTSVSLTLAVDAGTISLPQLAASGASLDAGTGLGDTGAETLAAPLADNDALLSLNLANNGIADGGAEALGTGRLDREIRVGGSQLRMQIAEL